MATPTNERVQKRRQALRAAGLRPVQIWVPDTRRPAFAQEARRQSTLLAQDPQEQDITAWSEHAASELEGWK